MAARDEDDEMLAAFGNPDAAVQARSFKANLDARLEQERSARALDKDNDGRVSEEEAMVIFKRIRDHLQNKLARVSDLFKDMDKSGDGLVDKEEVEEGLAALGYTFGTPEELSDIFGFLDHDGGGTIEYRELHAYLNPALDNAERGLYAGGRGGGADGGHETILQDQATIVANMIFDLVDKDRSGTISSQELLDGMRRNPGIRAIAAQYLAPEVPPTEAEVAQQKLLEKRVSGQVVELFTRMRNAMQGRMSELTEVFAALDENDDNQITIEDLGMGLSGLGFTAHHEQLQVIFQFLDTEGEEDGLVEYRDIERICGSSRPMRETLLKAISPGQRRTAQVLAATAHSFAAQDTDGDGNFDRREFAEFLYKSQQESMVGQDHGDAHLGSFFGHDVEEEDDGVSAALKQVGTRRCEKTGLLRGPKRVSQRQLTEDGTGGLSPKKKHWEFKPELPPNDGKGHHDHSNPKNAREAAAAALHAAKVAEANRRPEEVFAEMGMNIDFAPELREQLDRDADLSGTEQIANHVRALIKRRAFDKGDLRDPFRHFDGDGDGKVTREEFARGLYALGIRLHPDQLTPLIDRFDANGDDDVNFVEFVEFVSGGADVGGEGSNVRLLSKKERAEQAMQVVEIGGDMHGGEPEHPATTRGMQLSFGRLEYQDMPRTQEWNAHILPTNPNANHLNADPTKKRTFRDVETEMRNEFGYSKRELSKHVMAVEGKIKLKPVTGKVHGDGRNLTWGGVHNSDSTQWSDEVAGENREYKKAPVPKFKRPTGSPGKGGSPNARRRVKHSEAFGKKHDKVNHGVGKEAVKWGKNVKGAKKEDPRGFKYTGNHGGNHHVVVQHSSLSASEREAIYSLFAKAFESDSKTNRSWNYTVRNAQQIFRGVASRTDKDGDKVGGKPPLDKKRLQSLFMAVVAADPGTTNAPVFVKRKTKGLTNSRLTRKGFSEVMSQLLHIVRLKLPKGSASQIFDITNRTKVKEPCVTFDRFYAIVHELKCALGKAPKSSKLSTQGRKLSDFQMRSHQEKHVHK